MILVVRLLEARGIVVPRTHPIGLVEIRNPRFDTKGERYALAASAQAYEDAISNNCMRIATLVSGDLGEHEAHRLAEERFEEALDVLGPEIYGLSRVALLNAGLSVDLVSGTISPRLPHSSRPSTSFRVMWEDFPQCDWPQFLLTQTTDLSQRLIRSYHWSRKAQLEASRQLRVLFRWFAMETVWMLNKDDDIVPRLLWSLGFPNGTGRNALSTAFLDALANHPNIGAWRRRIEDILLGVKRFRNDSVHSGFRAQDVPRSTLTEFDEITLLACARVQNCARDGVLARLGSAQELFEYLPMLVENNRYIADVHGTILFGLENPMPRR